MSETSKAIFLSYASQDAAAAQRICDALRAAGVEVWFDQNELRGGDTWDANIRSQIKDCALFVPLISANTDARSEGYFRLEWKLAVDRSHLMADNRAFLLPVVIDDTPEDAANVPERFRERQWMTLKGGAPTPQFVEHIARLLAGGSQHVASRSEAALPSRATQSKGLKLGVAAALAVAAVGVGVWSQRPSANAPTQAVTGVAAKKTNDAPADRRSIAVLPFANLSGKAEDDYLADGLQEETLNALARLRDLKVISRTSVMEYKGKAHNAREIGQRLVVGSILEGSVRRDGNTLRLTVQLVDVQGDRHLMAANYDRDLGHLLDLQSTVARQVADALSATLSRDEQGELGRVSTNSGDAYDRYLRAAPLAGPDVDEKRRSEAKRLLADALRFDPDYADAHALLSVVHTWSFYLDGRTDDSAAARKSFERALAIDPNLPEGRIARGLHAMYVERNIDRAVAELSDVVQLRPNSMQAHWSVGVALRRRGRMDDALAHLIRAADLDPLNLERASDPIQTLVGLRRLPEALDRCRTHVRRFPRVAALNLYCARIESIMQKSIEPMRVAFLEYGSELADPVFRTLIETDILARDGRYLDAVKRWEETPDQDPMDRARRIGLLYHAAGDAARAEQYLRIVEREGVSRLKREGVRGRAGDSAAWLAIAQSLLGMHAEALATIDALRSDTPESRDATNGPAVSFDRCLILARAGRLDEAHAEVRRLLKVPFVLLPPDPQELLPVLIQFKDDPVFDQLINDPPRL